MNTPKKVARVAGFLYLIFIIALIFASAGTLDKLIVYGDAAATANNILAHPWMFRAGFMSDVLSAVLFGLAAWALYALLRPVNHDLALLFLLLNLAGVAIQCVSALGEFAAWLLLNGADYLKAFQPGQLQTLAMFSLDLHRNGFMIAQVFFGAWLLPLGYLVFKSGFLPKVLGVLLMLDFAGVLSWFFQFFLLPAYPAISYPGLAVGFIAEFSLSLWLLIMGVKVPGNIVPGNMVSGPKLSEAH